MKSSSLHLIFLLIGLILKGTDGMHDYFCIEVGSGDKNGVGDKNVLFPNDNVKRAFTFPSGPVWEDNRNDGFDSKDSAPYYHKRRDGDTKPLVYMNVFGINVKNPTDGKPTSLRGYYMLELTIPPSEDYRAIIIQSQSHGRNTDSIKSHSRDYHQLYAGFGEFVHDFPTEACKISGYSGDDKPNRYQYPPCKGLHLHDILPGNAFVYNTEAKPEYMNPPPNPNNTPKKFNLIWRFSDTSCNHVAWLFFRVSVAPKNGGANSGYYPVPLFLKFDRPTLRGAPDPLPSADDVLSCTVNLESKIPLYDVSYSFDPNRYGACSSKAGGNNEYDKIPFDIPKGSYVANQNTARCANKEQYCWSGEFNNAPDYITYVQELKKKKEVLCKCPDVAPTTTPTTTEDPNLEIEREKDRIHGIDADKHPGSVIWNYRVYHGIIGIIGTLFLTPVSIFISRYYKETFKSLDIMFNNLWFMVHLIAAIFSLVLHLFGWVSVYQGIKILGYSKADSAKLHRFIGWGAIGLCGIMTVLGGLRPFAQGPRKIVISLHWFLGMTYYALCLAGCILSAFIYGSPFATSDQSVEIDGMQYVVILISAWILIDIVFHLIMTIHGCRVEKKAGLKRQYLPEPIPIIDEYEEQDAPGFLFRKRMLVLYVGISLINTVLVCIWIWIMPAENRGFGFMTCTHDNENQYVSKIPEECRA